MLVKTKRIIKIDASLLSNSACLLKMWLMVNGYRARGGTPVALVQGSALHKYVEALRKGKKQEEALVEAVAYFEKEEKLYNSKTKNINVGTLINACHKFSFESERELSNYNIARLSNGEPLVECKFCIPFYEDDELLILLCGTIDSIGSLSHSPELFIIDDIKTSSAADPRKYLSGYKLSLQLMIYRIALEWLAENYQDEPIFDRIFKGTIGCRITGVFIPTSADELKEVTVKCSDIYYYSDEMVAETRQLVANKVEQLLRHFKSGERPLKEGILTGECQTYGGCLFAGACCAPGDTAMELVLKNNFDVVEYDPLTFR